MIRASPASTARPAPIRSAPATIVRSLSTSNSRAVAADAALAVDRRARGVSSRIAIAATREQRRARARARVAATTTSSGAADHRVPSGASQPAGVPWRR